MDFDTVKVPRKITSSPVAEAIVELRFESDVPSETIIGTAIQSFLGKYPKYEKLPILQLPLFVREKDPGFKFNPHYRLLNENFIIQIGPQCISISSPKEYKGWTLYHEQIKWVFHEIENLKFVKTPLRIGVRYVNFFENINIFEKIQTELTLANNSLINHRNFLRSEFDYNDFRCIIQISNDAVLENNIKGSSLDIDVISEDKLKIQSDLQNIVYQAHVTAKKLFFGVLHDDFLKSFNPEY